MLAYTATGRFKRDYRRMEKQGKKIEELLRLVRLILDEQPLPARHRDHALTGNWSGWRECHIRPDWLLVYRTTETEAIFARTGSHAELFG